MYLNKERKSCMLLLLKREGSDRSGGLVVAYVVFTGHSTGISPCFEPRAPQDCGTGSKHFHSCTNISSFSNNPGKMYPTKGQFDFSVQPLGGSEFSVQTCKFVFLFKGGI